MADNTHSLDLELSSSQYASIADASQTGLDLSTDFTVEAWVKLEKLPSTAGAGFTMISKFRSDVNGGYEFAIRSSDDKAVIRFGDASGNVTVGVGNTAITSGTWTHIAIAVDISVPSVEVYING